MKPRENWRQNRFPAKGVEDDTTRSGPPLRQHSLCGDSTAKPGHGVPLPVLPEGGRLGLHGRTDLRRAALKILTGTPKVYDQVSAGSGKTVHVHFCGDCGTRLWLSFERFPGAVGIYAGTFDDPC